MVTWLWIIGSAYWIIGGDHEIQKSSDQVIDFRGVEFHVVVVEWQSETYVGTDNGDAFGNMVDALEWRTGGTD